MDGLRVKRRPQHHVTWDGVPGPLLTNCVGLGKITYLYVLRFLHLKMRLVIPVLHDIGRSTQGHLYKVIHTVPGTCQGLWVLFSPSPPDSLQAGAEILHGLTSHSDSTSWPEDSSHDHCIYPLV